MAIRKSLSIKTGEVAGPSSSQAREKSAADQPDSKLTRAKAVSPGAKFRARKGRHPRPSRKYH